MPLFSLGFVAAAGAAFCVSVDAEVGSSKSIRLPVAAGACMAEVGRFAMEFWREAP